MSIEVHVTARADAVRHRDPTGTTRALRELRRLTEDRPSDPPGALLRLRAGWRLMVTTDGWLIVYKVFERDGHVALLVASLHNTARSQTLVHWGIGAVQLAAALIAIGGALHACAP